MQYLLDKKPLDRAYQLDWKGDIPIRWLTGDSCSLNWIVQTSLGVHGSLRCEKSYLKVSSVSSLTINCFK
mgnify:CR=1 FL=1